MLPTWRSCRSCCNPLVRIASQTPSRRSGSYTTVAGDTIKSVQIGWEAAGTLNADKSNAIVVTHFFSATSHAFGKYRPEDKAAGYWDAIIGPGKTIDTNKYYVLSSDTLVNLNANMPRPTCAHKRGGGRLGMVMSVMVRILPAARAFRPREAKLNGCSMQSGG